MGGLVSVFAVSVFPQVNDSGIALCYRHNTCIGVGSFSTRRRKVVTLPHRLRVLIRTNGLSVGTTILRLPEGGQRG